MKQDSVLELRQYTLYGAKRDTLISLFEENFIESQNELGAHVLGTFRDLDDPDRFVWFRGFEDMLARKQALEAFYGGPVWRAHKDAANATMLDSDNVLLLRSASPTHGLPTQTQSATGGIYTATIHYLHGANAAEFAEFFDRAMLEPLHAIGAHPIARLITEEQPNNFPRLPVREDGSVFVWLARWPSLAECDSSLARFKTLSGWRDSAPASLLPALMQKPEQLRLMPTPRSRMQ